MERFRAVADAAIDAIVLADSEGRVTYFNKAAERMFGYTFAEVDGQKLTVLMPERFHQAHSNGLGRFMATREARVIGKTVELVARKKDGREFPVEISLAAWDDAGGLHFAGILRDLTERQQLEETFRVLVESAPDAMVIVNEEGAMTLVNAQTELLFGYSREEMLGRPVEMLIPQRYRPRHTGHRRDYFKNPHARSMGAGLELFGLRKDGSEFPVEISLSPIKTSQGTLISGAIRDVTGRRKTEEELRKSEEKARKAYEELLKIQEQLIRTEQMRALGEMSAGVAHQFNNVLMMIQGLVDLALARFEDRDRVRRYLEEIRVSSGDGVHIVRRLQSFVRRAAGQELQTIAVSDVITHSVQITQLRWKDEAEKKGVQIHVVTDLQSVPPVEGLESELREVMVNLILNAVDAMPRGGTLTLQTRSQDNRVRIEVRDTGMGMSAEVREKLFIPFFSTKLDRGTGLGLFICRNIIHRMGGDIRVESRERHGATFTIELPAVRGATKKRKQTTVKQVKPRTSARILVIDDEPSICEVLKEFLDMEKHHVATFTDAEKAVGRFSREPFDLVITDLGMAPMSGWDVLREVRRINPKVKTILLTGWGASVEPEEAAAKGADTVLAKPIEMKPFLRVIDEMLGESS